MIRVPTLAWAVPAGVALQLWVTLELDRKGLIDKLIPWDECGYVFTAIANAHHLRSGAWSYVQYVHSPLALLPNTLGMLASDASLFAPYALNGIYLCALLAFVGGLYRGAGLLATAAAVLWILSVPYLFLFTSHVKTDFLGGVLLLMLAAHLFLAPAPQRRGPRALAVPAALAVAVVCSKPMAFYLPALLAVLLAASAAHQVARGARWREIAAHHALVLAVALGCYAALVLPHLSFFREYVAQALSSRWSSDASAAQKALHYLPFSGQRSDAGFEFWGTNRVAPLLALAGFAFAVRRCGARRALLLGAGCLLAAAAAALAPLVLSPQVQFSFGSFFAGLVAALVLYAHRHAQAERGAARLVNAGIVASSLFHFGLVTRSVQPWIPADAANMDRAQQVVRGFVAEMDPSVPGNAPSPSIYFTFTGAIPRFDFAIEFYRRYRAFPNDMQEAYARSDALVGGGLAAYQYVVTYTPGKLPAIGEANVQQELYQRQLFAAWRLEELRRLPYADAEYVLYRVAGRTEGAAAAPDQAPTPLRDERKTGAAL